MRAYACLSTETRAPGTHEYCYQMQRIKKISGACDVEDVVAHVRCARTHLFRRRTQGIGELTLLMLRTTLSSTRIISGLREKGVFKEFVGYSAFSYTSGQHIMERTFWFKCVSITIGKSEEIHHGVQEIEGQKLMPSLLAILPARDHLAAGLWAMRRSDRPQHLHCAVSDGGLGVSGELPVP